MAFPANWPRNEKGKLLSKAEITALGMEIPAWDVPARTPKADVKRVVRGGFKPVRVYHLEFPGCTIVDRGIQKGLKELKDYDPAQSREFLFQDSYYQAMTPEDLEAVLRCGGSSVALEDLPEGLEIACPHCGRETRCRKFMTAHLLRCTPA